MRIRIPILLVMAAVAGALLTSSWNESHSSPPEISGETGNPLLKVADGLYSYKGVDTRRGLQCVEYAERFYVTHYKGTFPYHNSGPGAFDIWEGISEGKDVGGWANYRKFFNAYPNGDKLPQADDMLLYDRTRGDGWGHIAIVVQVLPKSVVILEQNSGWDTRKVLPLEGNRIVDKGAKGIIRLKSKDLAESKS